MLLYNLAKSIISFSFRGANCKSYTIIKSIFVYKSKT